MDFDCVVVGAGVVGLAVARALLQAGRGVAVLEADGRAGTGTSSRNSGVIHGGIYYPKGSLKSRLCLEGREMLYAYAEARGINHAQVGKLIVATDEADTVKLEALYQHAEALGVALDRLDGDGVRAREPEVQAQAGVYSPRTGIIDQHELMDALEGDIGALGGEILFHSEVVSAEVRDGAVSITVASGGETMALSARLLVNAAGLGAQKLAHKIRLSVPASVPPLYLAKGRYFALSGKSPFRHLVYPMHNKAGLGVHAGLDLGGQCRFGPDVEWVTQIDYAVSSDLRDDFAEAIAEFWPAVKDQPERLQPDYAGIRPKVVPKGSSPGDFMIRGPSDHHGAPLVQLFGIESPGLTASLAIGAHVARLVPA